MKYKKVRYSALMLFCWVTVNAQQNDTIIFIDGFPPFINQHLSSSINGQGKGVYKRNGKQISKNEFEQSERQSDSVSIELGKRGNFYYKLLSVNKKIVLEEGYWLNGIRIRYYPNGTIKERGEHNTKGNIGKWYFYNKRGKLKKTKDFG